jgi:hypothetical protein
MPKDALTRARLQKQFIILLKFYLNTYLICTVAAVKISDRKDLNTVYKFRNLISVNRILTVFDILGQNTA